MNWLRCCLLLLGVAALWIAALATRYEAVPYGESSVLILDRWTKGMVSVSRGKVFQLWPPLQRDQFGGVLEGQ